MPHFWDIHVDKASREAVQSFPCIRFPYKTMAQMVIISVKMAICAC